MGYYPSTYYPSPHGIPCMSPYMRAAAPPPTTGGSSGPPLAQLLSPSHLMSYVSLYPYGNGGNDQYFQPNTSSNNSQYPMGYHPMYMSPTTSSSSDVMQGQYNTSFGGGNYLMDENNSKPVKPKGSRFYSIGKENNAPVTSNRKIQQRPTNTDICKGIESMNLNNNNNNEGKFIVPKLRVVKMNNMTTPQSYQSATATTISSSTSSSGNGHQIRLTSPSTTEKTSLCNMSTICLPAPIPSQSPIQLLEEALKNPRGTTNVYIRGLLPETTDESLYELARNFGKIKTAKAMIDTSTGYCKGFGFAEFETQEEAINCIKTLTLSGYQSSFAKQSFALRLKDLHDPASTNVYFSNLPRSMTEEDLEKMIQPFEIISIRILRDNTGQSRGVGFARFLNRTSAEQVIKMNNGKNVCCGGPIQVRFSDTNAQKTLKQQTAKKRSWRAQEYRMMTSHLTLGNSEEGDTDHDSDDDTQEIIVDKNE